MDRSAGLANPAQRCVVERPHDSLSAPKQHLQSQRRRTPSDAQGPGALCQQLLECLTCHGHAVESGSQRPQT